MNELSPSSEQQSVEERRYEIVMLVHKKGFMTIKALARHFDVTVQTIRRDLNELSDEGRLIRYRGGAGISSSVENVDYSKRQITNFNEKARIAKVVAGHIPNNSSLFLNIGTTTEAVARALVNHKGLHVITNNVNVALILTQNTNFNVIITGGRIRNRDGGVLGPSSRDAIEQFRVDFGIIGISGIDDDGMLLDFDYDEVQAARAIIKAARQTFLVTDHSKFARRPMVRLGSITEITALYTDRPPPSAIRRLLGEHDIGLHIASAE